MEQREQPASEEQARGVTDDAASPSRSDSTPEAGADAHPDDLDADLEEILGDLFDMFAAGVARARWPLEAEVHVSEVLGRLEATLAEDGLLPPDAEDGDPLGLLFAQVVAHAQGLRTARGLAVLRALAVFADDDFREHITSVADDLAASGIKEPAWARTIGRPAVERCWRFGDVFGSQESIHVVFAYSRRRHGLAVLIDHELGGGVKDCWVSEDPDQMWRSVRRSAQTGAGTFLDEISWFEARDRLLTAVALETCPVAPDQVEDVGRFFHLLAARLTLAADDEPAGTTPTTARADPAAPAPSKVPPSSGRTRRRREVLQLKVTLRGSKPPIWRRLEVPADITLDRLHHVLQVAFDWHGAHLHAFDTADRTYGDPGVGHTSERGVRLTRVAPVGGTLDYTYDFGDNWQHLIQLEKTRPAHDGVDYPRCTGGRRTAPPEDSGGIHAYQEMLQVLADPTHEEHTSTVEWLAAILDATSDDAPAFDPAQFRAADVTDALEHLRR